MQSRVVFVRSGIFGHNILFLAKNPLIYHNNFVSLYKRFYFVIDLTMDMIKRIGISLLSAGVIAYMVYVAWFGVTITSYGSLGMNILALAIVIGAAGYL